MNWWAQEMRLLPSERSAREVVRSRPEIAASVIPPNHRWPAHPRGRRAPARVDLKRERGAVQGECARPAATAPADRSVSARMGPVPPTRTVPSCHISGVRGCPGRSGGVPVDRLCGRMDVLPSWRSLYRELRRERPT